MVTIKDIAKEAGVSVMTVSYALNETGRIGTATRQHVKDVAQRMGYQPNAVARGLQRRRMDAIGVVFGVVPETLVFDGYYGRVLDGICRACGERKQKAVIFQEPSWDALYDNLSILADGYCDGLILITPLKDCPLIEPLLRKRIPFAIVGDSREDPRVIRLDIDNFGASVSIMRHLGELGHRRIAFLQGDLWYLSSEQRHQGYLQGLRELEARYNPALDIPCGYDPAGGYQIAQNLMALPVDERPTAIFCSNDSIAYGVLACCRDLGVRVPEDLSVIGIDDKLQSAGTTPPLTTLRQPYHDIGRRAVEKIVERVSHPDRHATPVGTLELLPAELILRDSVGPAPRLALR
ncbi:LacI family transcriptional regulator [Capsulimonas corticalis]|uniref:LacI family transcriptional regulator n=1 Tax=Capsulimonas corticalis TaxID=2219043 RepID=A0A402CUF1_9BACT|nr:LacI family DNA-binding transcriptional regulator [Capsulimonas corticalis]BDI28968.1 LacI family transcriptional regulator [Capsulimonas corticalis]